MEATGEWTPLSTMLENAWTLEYLQQGYSRHTCKLGHDIKFCKFLG